MLNHNETFVRLNREILDNTMGFFREMNTTLVTPFEKNRQGQPFPEMVEKMVTSGKRFQDEHQRLVTEYAQAIREIIGNVTTPIWGAEQSEPINWNGFDQMFQMNRGAVEQTMNLFRSATERMGHLPTMTPEGMNPEAYFKGLYSSCEQYLTQTRDMTHQFENLYRQTFGLNPRTTEERDQNVDVNLFNVQKFFQINEDVVRNVVDFYRTMTENMVKLADKDTSGAWKNHAEYLNEAWNKYRQNQETLTKRIEDFCRHFVPQNDWTKQFINLREVEKIVNYEDMVRLNQEIVTDTIEFFMNTQQQIVRLYEGKIDNQKAIDIFQTTINEFTRTHQANTQRIISHWEKAWESLNPATRQAAQPKETVAEAAEAPRKPAPKNKKK